jgi:hypothetical protein
MEGGIPGRNSGSDHCDEFFLVRVSQTRQVLGDRTAPHLVPSWPLTPWGHFPIHRRTHRLFQKEALAVTAPEGHPFFTVAMLTR